MCLSAPDSAGEGTEWKTSTKVIIGVISGLVVVVILPSLYAMYNMKLENAQRNRRLKNHIEQERRTHAAYLGKVE